MSPKVDEYIERSEQWPEEITALRSVLLDCGLTEEIKWGKPCYSNDGENIAIIQEMKHFLSLMFFKGALLEDPEGLLREQGKNTRSARRIELTSVDEVTSLADAIRAYVLEAVDVAEAGWEVEPAPELELVAELQRRLDEDPALKAAFEGLTPGRQREYNIYFSGAKQAATREARVERYADKILEGKGFRDR